jgi:hypothetical protein
LDLKERKMAMQAKKVKKRDLRQNFLMACMSKVAYHIR